MCLCVLHLDSLLLLHLIPRLMTSIDHRNYPAVVKDSGDLANINSVFHSKLSEKTQRQKMNTHSKGDIDIKVQYS